MLGRVQREQRASFEQELMQVTRGLAVTIDRDLLGVTTALQALASSTLLDDGRLSAFHRRANALLAVHKGWHDVVLIDPRALKTLMSVRRPIGSEPIATEVLRP